MFGFGRQRWTIFCAVSALVLFLLYRDFLTSHVGSPYSVKSTVLEQEDEIPEFKGDTPLVSETTPFTTASSALVDALTTTEDAVHTPPSETATFQGYTKQLVIAKTMEEDVSWVAAELSSEPNFSALAYVMDSPSPDNPIPSNKGHESMAYLTHIIERYDNLSDVTTFMHAHRITWHNNDLLDADAAKMVRHLSAPHVIRSGYMNMRCHWSPGCPAWMHPNQAKEDNFKPEEVILRNAWTELFPEEQVPEVLAQPCCAQLAVSRERIRSLTRERYIQIRDWLLNSTLEDRISGRVFEYVWQYIWGGVYEFCPLQNICYCDGYGICFGGEQEYDEFFKLRDDASGIYMKISELGLNDNLEPLIREKNLIEAKLQELKSQAFERGKHPRNRALEAGRPWKEGDGF